MRALVRESFLHALKDCSVERAFARNIEYSRGVLRICDDLYPLDSYSRVFVVSIGKASYPMVGALAATLGRQLEGIAAGPAEPKMQTPGFRYFAGGHPTPNQESIRAAEAILKKLESLPAQSLVIFLLSGGGSSIVEKPMDHEITLEDIAQTYRVLVHSGAPIHEINAIRKHLSAVKGGRLALAARNAQQVSIMISDVPENALDSLASGPAMPDSSRAEDCYEIASRHGMVQRFPSPVAEAFRNRLLEETPKSDDPIFSGARWWPVLSNSIAQRAAASYLSQAGFAVEIDNSCDDWDYAAAADYLLDRLRKLRAGVSRACIISGGEVTVNVSGEAGTGGRNQQFALYCAEKIADQNIAVLSAGTDGIDGNSPAAGAIVDGSSAARASKEGLALHDCERRFDAYQLFDRLQDTVMTGPTGTNVRDLRLLLAW